MASMTIKNAKPKRHNLNRSQRNIAKRMEAFLASERMDNEISYRSRGRHLEKVMEADLKRRFAKCLRREFNIDRSRRTEMRDIFAELSVRGINRVVIPADLREEMSADISKRLYPPWEGYGPKFN
jgi:hypothetical protein